MSSYATVQDFIDYVGTQESIEITNLDDPMASSVNEDLLEKALTHATAEINAYLAGNYSLPLASIPPILMYDCCEIARYRLDKLKTRDDVTERYNNAIARLRDISKGLVTLGLDAAGEEAASGATSEPAYISANAVFTHETLSGF